MTHACANGLIPVKGKMRNAILVIHISIGVVMSGFAHAGAAEREQLAGYTLPDDPAAAWVEVEKVHRALQPPTAWRTQAPTPEEVAQFQKQVGQTAVSFADKAEEFIKRFPTNENIGDAHASRWFMH